MSRREFHTLLHHFSPNLPTGPLTQLLQSALTCLFSQPPHRASSAQLRLYDDLFFSPLDAVASPSAAPANNELTRPLSSTVTSATKTKSLVVGILLCVVYVMFAMSKVLVEVGAGGMNAVNRYCPLCVYCRTAT